MTRGHILVDGQRQPRPEPVNLTLRDPDQLVIATPIVFESADETVWAVWDSAMRKLDGVVSE